jgi:uncharacterized protein YggE
MKRAFFLCLSVCAAACVCRAQASGNVGYAQSGGSARAEQNERNKRQLSQVELPPNGTSMFVEASVLMNVKADEFVAVFGLAQECVTVAECNRMMDATVAEFTAALKRAGVAAEDVFVDFAAQNKIYGFQLTGDVAKERLVGFELKKNVSVRYGDKAMLDKLVILASGSKIFDLIKVDYVVKDVGAVEGRLMEEAAKVLEQKAARYQKLLSVKLRAPAQVYAERPSIYFPTKMYDSYTASEEEDVTQNFNEEKYTVQHARKSRTFFFNALSADGFDTVVNPVVIEPVVQFTLYLKVKYDIEQPASR